MENKNQEALAMKVIVTLEAILNKMADVLNHSFEPGDPESMKLLREFRATMNSRRTWEKFCGFHDGNEETCNTLKKKVEAKVSNQPAPTGNKPILMNKPAATSFDETIFKGIKNKNNNQIPQVDLNSGLIVRR